MNQISVVKGLNWWSIWWSQEAIIEWLILEW